MWSKIVWIPIISLLVGLFLGFRFGFIYQGNLNFLNTIINIDLFNVDSLGITLGAILTAFFAFRQYKKQRDYENISKRYLEDGFENLISYLNERRIMIENNYVLILQALNKFVYLEYEKFKIWFKDRQPSGILSASMPYSFGICFLVLKNKYFKELCIKNFAENVYINDYFVSEFPKLLLNEQDYFNKNLALKENREKLATELNHYVTEKYNKSHQYSKLYDLISNLEIILFRLRELNIDSYEKLENTNQDKEIVRLSSKFKELSEGDLTESILKD